MQGPGQSAAFPWTSFLGCLLLETSTYEHVGPRGLGGKDLLGRVVLIQEGLAGGIKEQRPARDWPSLAVNIELPGPICREYTSVPSLLPLSRPKISGRGPKLWPLLWFWTCLALAHLGANQMAQIGWCNSHSGFLGKKKSATDTVPGGPKSEGRTPIGGMEGTEPWVSRD